MSYRVRRKFTSSKFIVDGQLCKIFLEPMSLYKGSNYLWNVGFAIGKSNRQLNDWFQGRKNKRSYSITRKIVGRSGLKAIRRGFQEVLKLRWTIPIGDALVLDCTSGDPERQFRAWSRWHRYHPEWIINKEKKEFYWYRPPYLTDKVWEEKKVIIPLVPDDLLMNTAGTNYFKCFDSY